MLVEVQDRRYRNPCVVEALCEIYFSGSKWDDTVPGQFYDRVKEQFPVKRQRAVHEAQVSFSAEGEAAAGVRRHPPWMQFVSQKGNRLIQLGKDVVVVNQLRPYPHFEDWSPVISSALETYRELAKPEAVARLGVRYINRVVIPEPQIRMEDYFTMYPKLPEEMGGMHGAFMLRVEVPGSSGNHMVVVTFGSTSTDKPKKQLALLLDLYDIYSPPRPLPLEEAFDHVSIGHANVVVAFEGSITDRLRTLLEPEE
jgi:uncharacterized protein (TIGR04255 family)